MTEVVAVEGSGVYPLLESAEGCCSGEAVMGWRGQVVSPRVQLPQDQL